MEHKFSIADYSLKNNSVLAQSKLYGQGAQTTHYIIEKSRTDIGAMEAIFQT